jgi:hypothetical protein
MAVAAADEGQEPEQVEQHGDHRVKIFSGSEPTDQALGYRTDFWRGTGSGTSAGHEPGDRALGGVDAELEELPWMRGAPHKGFAAAIFPMRVAISAFTEGRPPVDRRDSWVQ